MTNHENNEEVIDLRDNIRRITNSIDINLVGTKDYPAIIHTEIAYYLLENYPDNPNEYSMTRLLPCPDNSSYLNCLKYIFDSNQGIAKEIYIKKLGRQDRDVVVEQTETNLSNTGLDTIFKLLNSKETNKLNPIEAEDLLKESIKAINREYGSRDRGIQGIIGRIARKSS